MTSLPRLSTSAAPPVDTLPFPAPPPASRTALVPLSPRAAATGGTHPATPGIFHTYPPSASIPRDDVDEGSPSPTQPVPPSTAAAAAEGQASPSRELAVVPFVGSNRDPGSLRSDNHRHESTVAEAGGGPVLYGELAPTTISTERVCPHCLRPYDFYDEDLYADLYDTADAFFRPTDALTKQLPPPPGLPTPQAPQEQQHQQQSSTPPQATSSGGRVCREGATPPRVAKTRTPSVTRSRSPGGGHSGPVFPPPAVAFTAHYFRALPPPAAIAAAVAMGTSPLAIEDYHSPLLEQDEQAEQQQQPVYAAVVVGGQHARALSSEYSGALVPARAMQPRYVSGGSPATRKAPASPLKLMQSEEEEANEQVSPPDDKERELLRELVNEEEEEQQRDREGSPTSPIYSPNAPAPAPSNGYYKHYFKELRQLGRGTYGGVYLCRHLMCGVNLGDFALKKIPVGDKAGYLQSVLREVRILEEVRRHPNVVEYKHSWVEDAQLADFGPPVRCLFILMEYASAGSLDAYLEKYGTHLSTLAVWYFFLSAVAGTAHLHQKHILHRDLKPQNLLLAGAKGRPPRVLVSDFGTAALLGDISYERSGGTGTLEYMAPELFETAASPCGIDTHYVNHHTVASDVWSLGMILYYLAFDATLPDRREDGSVILNTPRQTSYGRPLEMMQLMEAMLQLDPAKRPRCSDILGSARVQSILRTFNQDDLTQWDVVAQQHQQGRVRKGAAEKTKTPSPPQGSLTPRLAHSAAAAAATVVSASPGVGGGRPHPSAHRGSSGGGNRHRITVTSTTAQALPPPRDRQFVSNDSTTDNEKLFSSRVVELQSTMTLMDLAATQPASGTTMGDEAPPPQHTPHGRGRRVRRLSSTAGRHEATPEASGSLGHRPRSSQMDTMSSLGGTPPPHLVDEGVQTDPVNIVYE
jgi:serine/threonine protein kinase